MSTESTEEDRKLRSRSCAILADRHRDFSDGMRSLLKSAVQTVYVVADSDTLLEGAKRLRPVLVVMDLSFANNDFPLLMRSILEVSPASRVIVLTAHDELSATRLTLEGGAAGVVLKRCAGRDFLPAVDAVLRDEIFVSPEMSAGARESLVQDRIP